MKLLLTTIAAVLLVGCGESQSPEPPTVKASGISIIEAIRKGNIEAVKQHLAAGMDVNEKVIAGVTPLHIATHLGHKEIAELLIAEGADVNAKRDDGFTALHLATSEGHKEVVELLIANGADVNTKDDKGRTPLDWAILNKQTEIADLLRKHGGKTAKELIAAGN